MRIALAVLVAALALPAAASASQAYYQDDPFFGPTIEYVAADGEANDLTIAPVTDTSFTITDPGADITAGDGCTTSGPHSVTCEAPFSGPSFNAKLGDGDDRFTSDHVDATVDGGPGHDVLDAGTGGGTLMGGDDDDVLHGNGQRTTLRGGPGDDELDGGGFDILEGGPGADAINGGGTGGDTVSYRDHTEPVTVDLSKPGSPAGAAGEGDMIQNVDNAYGGEGPDVITAPDHTATATRGSTIVGYGGDDTINGGPGRDDLLGGTGNDTIRGGPGHDLIHGDEGRDTLFGDAGNDYLFGADGYRNAGIRELAEQDKLVCGEGADGVEPSAGGPRPLDVVDQTCEAVRTDIGAIQAIGHLKVEHPVRRLRMDVRCSSAGPCRVSIALRAHRRLAGSAKRDLHKQERATLVARLTKRARGELAREGVLKLRLSLVVRSGPSLKKRKAFSYYYVVRTSP